MRKFVNALRNSCVTTPTSESGGAGCEGGDGSLFVAIASFPSCTLTITAARVRASSLFKRHNETPVTGNAARISVTAGNARWLLLVHRVEQGKQHALGAEDRGKQFFGGIGEPDLLGG